MPERTTVRNLVRKVINNHKTDLPDRCPQTDYLYVHKIGNKLPKSIKNKIYKVFTKTRKAKKYISEHNHSILSKPFSKRISPRLLYQLTFLDLASIVGDLQCDSRMIAEMIIAIENKRSKNVPMPKHLAMSKHTLLEPFKGEILKNYSHTHVSIIPGYIFETYSKHDNLEDMVDNLINSGKPNFNKIDENIVNSPLDSKRRTTGYWLITKEINNEIYFLAITPHGNNRDGITDHWILDRIKESEKLFGKKKYFYHNKSA